MSEVTYDIPGDVNELFAEGEAQYQIRDPCEAGDNVFAMSLFLECVNVPDWMVVEDRGTQVILDNGETRLCIDSGGLGDFDLHGYDVSIVTEAASDSDNTVRANQAQASASQNQVPALSAQQIISKSGNVNMLEGRTMHLNLNVPKKSSMTGRREARNA